MMKPICLCGVVIALIAPVAIAAVDVSQAQKDWQNLAELVTQFQQEFMSRSNIEKKGDTLPDEWNEWRTRFEQAMAEFKERYGATAGEVTQAFEGVQRPLDVAMPADQAFMVASGIDVAAQQKQLVDAAMDLGRESYTKWKNLDAAPTKMELKVDYAQRALNYFGLAKKLDPEGSGYDEFLAQAQAAYDESYPEWEKVLKELTWPGHNPDFAGPGDPDELAQAAVEYLSGNKWTKPEYDDEHIPIAACVRGKDWEVYKKTALGEPTQYSLDMFVAFQGTKDPKIAYAYEMVLYTREEPGVEKGLPFRYGNSRQYAKYKMLMENVPKGARSGGGGAAGGGGARPTSGFSGFLWRLILAVALLAGGLVGAAPLLKKQVPALAGLCDTLGASRGRLGIVVAAVGALCFLRALVLYFSPLTDLLPQAVAILLGLALAKDTLLGGAAGASPAGEAPSDEAAAEPAEGEGAPGKPAGFVARHRGLLEGIARHELRLGVASLFLGIVHLLLAGLWLF
ncbi:MAG: hypothetical protein JXR94_01745 [Candidatus Hydrogenedentes bacterium]|nr:hypothetical protein [Candidatus Hydrogenedentota bacterium]